jgi:hypothetical protein
MGSIYFIQSESGPIKIGYTDKAVQGRITALQTGNAEKLNLLAVADGGRHDETIIHKRFAKYRLNGEWFKPAQEIIDYILPIPDLNFVQRKEFVSMLEMIAFLTDRAIKHHDSLQKWDLKQIKDYCNKMLDAICN